MLSAKFTVLLSLHSVRMVLLVFGHVVVALLALCTFQSNLSTHLVTSVIIFSQNLGIKKRPNSSLDYYNTLVPPVSTFFEKKWPPGSRFDISRIFWYRSYYNVKTHIIPAVNGCLWAANRFLTRQEGGTL